MGEKVNVNIDYTTIPEEVEQTKEYNFDEGLQEILKRVEALLSHQDYVVVGINAIGADVGKTYLKNSIAGYFLNNGIIAVAFNNPDQFDLENLRFYQSRFTTKKVVIVFESFASFYGNDEEVNALRKFHNIEVAYAGDQFNVPITHVDVWVGLCRPDRPFPGNSGADVVICNEKAVDKKR
jgi:hypothetical protein